MRLFFTTAEEAEKFWRKMLKRRLIIAKLVGFIIWSVSSVAATIFLLAKVSPRANACLAVLSWTCIFLYIVATGVFLGQHIHQELNDTS